MTKSIFGSLGDETRYTWYHGMMSAIKLPGSSVDDITAEFGQYDILNASNKNGVRMFYKFPGNDIQGGAYGVYSISGPEGYNKNMTIGPGNYYLVNVTKVQDSLGNSTLYEYNNFDSITRVVKPEGDEWRYTYDDRDNVVGARHIAKVGSGQVDTFASASYPTGCANTVICNKPTSQTDARGSKTDFTYDLTHGGILTVSHPATPDGIRPVEWYGYTQRYAWIKDANGSYIRADSPIWLRTEEHGCKTSSTVDNSCAAGVSDEIVVRYDFGPDAGPNNLLLRGKAVAANGQILLTCFGYDSLGNKISETKPRANLAACS